MGSRIGIVGGGISGLWLAWKLRTQLGARADIRLFEAADRPGGCVWTRRMDGWQVELGPNGFLDSRTGMIEACRELGLDQRLERANPTAAKRYIQINDRLFEAPASPWSFLSSPILSWKGKIRAAMEPLIRRHAAGKDESIAEFGRRRLGSEATESLLNAVVTGIYAGDSERLSLASCFPRLAKFESEHGSILRGQIRAARAGNRVGTLTAPIGGMQVVIDELSHRLRDAVKLGCPVSAIECVRSQGQASRWIVTVHNGDAFEFEILVLGCPGDAQSRLLRPIDKSLAMEVDEIAYAPVVIAAVGFPSEHCGMGKNGFGYLSPCSERRAVLGVIFSSAVFSNLAPKGCFQFRAILGGWHRPDVLEWDDDRVVNEVLHELSIAMRISVPPVFTHVHRWPRAIPQYFVGHNERLQRIDRLLVQHRGLHLCGNLFRGVALNDCVIASNRIADAICSQLSSIDNASPD